MTPDARTARALFDAPILRGLGERDRSAVLSAARFASVAKGEQVYGADASADSVFVVVQGAVELQAQRRGEAAPSVIRVARAGESFGEDALLFGGTRRLAASAQDGAEIVEVPKVVLERALSRSGADAALGRELRFAERSAIADLLRTIAFTRELSDVDFEILLDGSRTKSAPRGSRVFSIGEPAGAFYLIVEGLIQLQSMEGDVPQVRAYLGRGDFFGDEEIVSHEPRALDAVATGECELVEVPAAVLRTLSDRNPKLLSRVRRIQTDRAASQAEALSSAGPRATQHVLRDVYRMQMARSMLVIDQDTCVRCGHCAWTCESLHGVSRLVRRGDKVVTSLAVLNEEPKSLMLPSSCQHCKNPLCMVDCPTGAIGRDPHGEVFIREELCTGCGSCAKACPWDNIQMAPRPKGALVAESLRSSAKESFAEIAVKCDLCRGYEAPACVQACPTESIFRLEPAQDIAEVAVLFGNHTTSAPKKRTASNVPDVALASGIGIGLGAAGWILHARGVLTPGGGFGLVSGWVALILIALLALYPVPKRFARLWMKRRDRKDDERAAPSSRVRPFYRAHLAIGALAIAAVMIHAGPHLDASLAGALGLTFWIVSGLGVFGALAYRFVPVRLSRLERKGVLPEDLGHERERLFDRLHREASGTSELAKSLLERVLTPYARAPLGPLSLLFSGRSQRSEEAALNARIDALLEGRGADKRAGIDPLVRTVVELRALPVRVWLSRALRGWLIAHIVVTGIFLALLALHVAT